MENNNPSVQKNPIKYKFLRKALVLDRYDENGRKLERYTKMRRIYFKQISEYPKESSKGRYYPSEKQLNYLTRFKLPLSNRSHLKLMDRLKSLKCLEICGLGTWEIKFLIRFIMRIPKTVETIIIKDHKIMATTTGVQSLYKNLSRFRNLKILEKDITFQHEDSTQNRGINWTKIEYNSIRKYIPRLKNLKKFCCKESAESKEGLKEFQSEDGICPSVTHLSMDFFLLQTDFFQYRQLMPIFPSLRQLTVFTQKSNVFLDPSLFEDFKSLVRLEQLNLQISTKINEREYLFKGLLHLPLLTAFDLAVFDIQSDERAFLVEFLRKQSRLTSLSIRCCNRQLSSRVKCKEYNEFLEMICQTLNNKTKLKHLYLKGTGWSLESLSRGLGRVGMTNQLKRLEIDVFDDFPVTSSTAQNRVEGLCDFIKRQTLSLRALYVAIECIKEDVIVDSLVKVIGDAEKLKHLHIALNMESFFNSFYNKLVVEIHKKPFYGCPSFSKTFHYLNQTLQQLKELSSLHLKIKPIQFSTEIPTGDASIILDTLPLLKSLRLLTLHLPFDKQSTKGLFLSQIKTLAYCVIRTFNDDSESEKVNEIEKVYQQTSEQIYFRQKLTH